MHAAIGGERIVREARSSERCAAPTDEGGSLVTLARGTALELGDLVCAIQIRAELMRAGLFADRSGVDAIVGAAAAAARLLSKLRLFAGSAAPSLEPLDLASPIREVEGALRLLLPPGVALELHLDTECPRVDGDPQQLRELVSELVLNASEAIGDGPGEIEVTTRPVRGADPASFLEGPDAFRSARLVCLEVRDSGCGMDEWTLERIFDPFFSTRGAGRGLGLAAALGIARAHRGGIAARSRPGSGSTFTAYLPAAHPEPSRDGDPRHPSV